MDKFSGLKKSFEKIYLKAPKPLGPAMIGPDDEKSGQADVEKRGHKTIQQGLKRADFQLKQSVFYNVLETSVPKPKRPPYSRRPFSCSAAHYGRKCPRRSQLKLMKRSAMM
jgi:hypothetical protein